MHGRPPRFPGSTLILDRQSTPGRYASGRCGLLFELGVRPGAEPIARYRSGDVVAALSGRARSHPEHHRFPFRAQP